MTDREIILESQLIRLQEELDRVTDERDALARLLPDIDHPGAMRHRVSSALVSSGRTWKEIGDIVGVHQCTVGSWGRRERLPDLLGYLQLCHRLWLKGRP